MLPSNRHRSASTPPRLDRRRASDARSTRIMNRTLSSLLRWTPVVMVAALPSYAASQETPELRTLPHHLAMGIGVALLLGALVGFESRGDERRRAFARRHRSAAAVFAATQLLLVVSSTIRFEFPIARAIYELVLVVGALALSVVDFFDPTRWPGREMSPLTAFGATLLVGAFWTATTALVARAFEGIRSLRRQRLASTPAA